MGMNLKPHLSSQYHLMPAHPAMPSTQPIFAERTTLIEVESLHPLQNFVQGGSCTPCRYPIKARQSTRPEKKKFVMPVTAGLALALHFAAPRALCCIGVLICESCVLRLAHHSAIAAM